MPEWILALLPGVGTIALAILSGAGGSALLELYYKPRRDRRRVAGLLLAEIALNTEIIRIQAEVRKSRPNELPEDFAMSSVAFEAAADLLSELPPELLVRVVTLYNRYTALNRSVFSHGDAFRQREVLPDGDPQKDRLSWYMDAVLDSFNTGLDKSFDAALALRDALIKLAKLKREGNDQTAAVDLTERVKEHLVERERRLAARRRDREK